MININCQYIHQGACCKNDKIKDGVCIEYGNREGKTCEFKKPWPKPKAPPPPPPKR